jgi:L-amino acid N-acyltransferase YncA
MKDIEVRPVRDTDAPELATILNEIISRGGTTALEEPFTPDALAKTLLIGPDVICCFAAVRRATHRLMGFQLLERSTGLPDYIGDIGTFVRVGLTQRGVGSTLFKATRTEAQRKKLQAINATIRADNIGGNAFYDRMGFVYHRVQRAVPLKDGTPVDRISKLYFLNSNGSAQNRAPAVCSTG